jgi:hypothetical protein
MRGDHDRVTEEGGYSFHSVRPDAFNYVWDNSIEPVLDVDSARSSSSPCATPRMSR